MSIHTDAKGAIRYSPAGSLPKPGVVGRAVRLLLGLLCLSIVADVIQADNPVALGRSSWWLVIGLGLVLVNYVVNLGFGLSTKNRPVIISVLLIGGAAGLTYLAEGTLAGEPLFTVTWLWLVYLFGHLGISFILAAGLATPGCEMRAIPQLLGSLRKQETREHYCPAFIDAIDRWEWEKRHPAVDGQPDTSETASRDLLGTTGRLLGVYGLFFLVVQLAGMSGSRPLAVWVTALAFLVVAAVNLLNILRSRRIHSYLIGPLFLVAGIAMTLYGLDRLTLGTGTWGIIVNGSVIAGACLALKLELLLGKYRA